MRLNPAIKVFNITARKKRLKSSVIPYCMILPQLIGFCIFSMYPIVWVLRYAWFDYNGITAVFNGIDNFIRAFTRDAAYWNSLLNTFVLSFGKLSVEIPLALILAVILNGALKGKSFFRTMFFMPSVISTAVIGLIFSIMFSSFGGIVNNLLESVHLISQPINWFGEKWAALIVLGLASIWSNFGVNMLFFLSGLQNIPKELYESADIDGAGNTSKFFRITLPMLAPMFQVILMLAILGSLKVSDLVLVLTNGQPAGETEVVMTYIFKFFFSYDSVSASKQIGYASALSIITAIIIGIFTAIYLRMTRNMQSIEGDVK